MPKTPPPIIHAEERVAPTAVREYPGNTNKHPERNRQAIRASLQEFQQVEALTVWGTDTLTGETRDQVLGGNGRLIVMRDDLAWPEILIRRIDCTPKQAKALNIALNRTGRLSERDDALEVDALKDLRDEQWLLEAAGYTDDELDDLIRDLKVPEEPKEAQVRSHKTVSCPECGAEFRAGQAGEKAPKKKAGKRRAK